LRIITWNCPRRTIAQCREQLAALAPDILALQEVSDAVSGSSDEAWAGWMPQQGLAVAVRAGLTVSSEAETAPEASISGRRFVVRSDAAELRILNVWAHSELGSYVSGVHRLLDESAAWLHGGPSIVLGDFNAHPAFDKEHPKFTFASISDRLKTEFGLVSAYHGHREMAHGAEGDSTYFHQWSVEKPFHLDYCFVPELWAAGITSVTVGSFADYAAFSDHRPVIVDLAMPGIS
jgi:endonuclease/exonuclease/phosphatase family metal-dependent hydrolase